MKRAHVIYSGDVHGVGFRFTAIDVAKRYKIGGWVKNTADGKVEVVAEAVEPALKSFLTQLDTATSHYIRDKNISWESATTEFTDFQIRF
ncbi:MAG: acylphosphatase [Candidatus Margulisiibacteriota bacterium]